MLVPSLITSFSGTDYSIYYTTMDFWISLRFISDQDGLLFGVRLRQRLIKSNMPGEKCVFDRIGFLVGSNEGRSLVITLCKMNPKDHISIFSKLSLNKFSGKMIFSFI